MGQKTTEWIFKAKNKQNLTRENMNMAKKEIRLEKNLISSESSTKQSHKDYLCQTKNRQDATKYKRTNNISESSKLAQRE